MKLTLPFVRAHTPAGSSANGGYPCRCPRIYFKGKTIRIIVGFSASGGYDVYARAIARHMGKNLPGNPSIIVENMAGAASLISANYVYKAAKSRMG